MHPVFLTGEVSYESALNGNPLNFPKLSYFKDKRKQIPYFTFSWKLNDFIDLDKTSESLG